MSISSRVFSSSVWVLSGSIFSSLSNFVVFAVLARIIGPAEFGLVAMASVFIDLCRIFLSAGVADAVVQRKEWDESFVSTAFWFNLALALTIFLVMVVGTTLLPLGQTDERIGQIAVVFAIAVVIEASALVPLAKLRRQFKYRGITIRTIIVNLASGAVGVGLAFLGYGVWALVAQRLFSAIGTAVGTWLIAQWRPAFVFSKEHARSIANFTSSLVGGQALSVLNAQVPSLVIGLFMGPLALAQFRVGSRALNLITSMTITPLQSTAVAGLARLPDREAVARGYQRLTAASALIACPIFFGCAAIAPDFVKLVFGPNWDIAGQIMRWCALVVGPSALLYFLRPAMTATNQNNLSLVYSAGAVVGSVIAALIAIPFGVVAAAVSQTIRSHVTLPLALRLLKKGVGVEPIQVLRNIAQPYLGGLALFLVALVLEKALAGYSAPARMGIIVVAGAATYAGFMLTFGRKFLMTHYEVVVDHLPERIRSKAPKWGTQCATSSE